MPTTGTPCRVNERDVVVDAPPATPLLYALRNDLGLTGTRYGCGGGDCGACMVLVDGLPTNACDTPLEAAAGRAVTTVEGLDGLPVGRALIHAFLAEQAAQCGYCASGILIAATALLQRNPAPDEDDVRTALDRCLCRCGSHPRIIRAVLRAGRELRHD